MSEKTQEQILDEAAQESAGELGVKRVSISDMSELEDFEFYEDVDEVASDLEIPIEVLQFDHPTKAGKQINYAMRQITPEEHAEIFDTLFDTDMLSSVLEDAIGEDGSVDQNSIKTNAVAKMAENGGMQNATQKRKDQQVAAIYRCMLHPKKKSLESIAKLPRDMQDSLFEACMKQHDRVWRFQ